MPSPAADPSFVSDSTTTPNFRQVGVRNSSGKLVRGHVVPPTADVTISGPSLYAASIPSKFETLLNPQANTHQDGFHSRTARFINNADEAPAPGQYDGAHQSELAKPKESWSKKGLGGFVSKDPRFRSTRTSRLGPGQYNPISKSHDFNRTDTSAVFKLNQTRIDPSIQPTTLLSHPLQTAPHVGPGSYEPHAKKEVIHEVPPSHGPAKIWEKVSTRVHSHSQPSLSRSNQSFLSTSARFHQRPTEVPPPGLYNPEPISTTAQRPYTSTFQSKTKRPSMERNVRIPGPGFYSADLSEQVVEPQPAAHRAFRTTNLDRFGRPLQRRTVEEVLPGPGAYEKVAPRASELRTQRRAAIATTDTTSSAPSSTLSPPRSLQTTKGGAGIILNSPTRHASIPTTASTSTSSMAAAITAANKHVIATSQIRPPGPAYYNPDPHYQEKRSFHLNATRKWI